MGRLEETFQLTLSEEKSPYSLYFKPSICLQVWENHGSVGKNTVT